MNLYFTLWAQAMQEQNNTPQIPLLKTLSVVVKSNIPEMVVKNGNSPCSMHKMSRKVRQSQRCCARIPMIGFLKPLFRRIPLNYHVTGEDGWTVAGGRLNSWCEQGILKPAKDKKSQQQTWVLRRYLFSRFCYMRPRKNERMPLKKDPCERKWTIFNSHQFLDMLVFGEVFFKFGFAPASLHEGPSNMKISQTRSDFDVFFSDETIDGLQSPKSLGKPIAPANHILGKQPLGEQQQQQQNSPRLIHMDASKQTKLPQGPEGTLRSHRNVRSHWRHVGHVPLWPGNFHLQQHLLMITSWYEDFFHLGWCSNPIKNGINYHINSPVDMKNLPFFIGFHG